MVYSVYMLTKLGFLLMVNGTIYGIHTDPMGDVTMIIAMAHGISLGKQKHLAVQAEITARFCEEDTALFFVSANMCQALKEIDGTSAIFLRF